MLDCISVENMRLSDQQTIDAFVPSLVLMGRAADGVYRAVSWKGPVAVVTGSGNNGGDGFALACILRSQGIACTVFTLSNRLSGDSSYYAEKAETAGVPIQPFQFGAGCLKGYSIIVDCLLGTGFRGGLRDNYRDAINEINEADAYVVSVDINSGMNGDSGEAETAVYSDLTVTIGYVKNGLVTGNAGAYMKRLVCADIGIRLARTENKICDDTQWQKLCPESEEATSIERSGMLYYRCPPWLDMTPIYACS